MTLLAAFAMHAIMDDRRGNHQPKAEDEDDSSSEPVIAGDEYRKTHVDDDQPHGDRDDHANLGPHKMPHARSLRRGVAIHPLKIRQIGRFLEYPRSHPRAAKPEGSGAAASRTQHVLSSCGSACCAVPRQRELRRRSARACRCLGSVAFAGCVAG